MTKAEREKIKALNIRILDLCIDLVGHRTACVEFNVILTGVSERDVRESLKPFYRQMVTETYPAESIKAMLEARKALTDCL